MKELWLSLPKYIGRVKFTGSKDVENSKQGKFKENHTQMQQNQITESQRLRKILKAARGKLCLT